MTAEILYPVEEVAKLWRCSTEHVYEQIRRGRLHTVDIARGRAKTRVPESAIARFLAANGTEPPAGPQTPPNPTKPRATHPDPMPVPVPTPDPQARPKRVSS